MSKVSFTKLGLKKNEEIKTIKFNDIEIEVKQYLPTNDKLALISNVINNSHSTNYANPVLIEVMGSLEIIYAYTNINFTDKQKEDPMKLYDLLNSSGLIDAIVSAIPQVEYETVIDGISDTIEAVYAYENSAMGILNTISKDYSNLELDATKISEKLSDEKNLGLLKEVVTKLG
jgi:hypothetical protein